MLENMPQAGTVMAAGEYLQRVTTCERYSIDLGYRAKAGPRSYRFSPHTLVDTSSRPHFRGYCR